MINEKEEAAFNQINSDAPDGDSNKNETQDDQHDDSPQNESSNKENETLSTDTQEEGQSTVVSQEENVQPQEENSTETSTTPQDQEENSTETSTTPQDQEENSTETSTTPQDQEENSTETSNTPQDQEENSIETSTTPQDQEENSTETSTTSQDQEENSTETSTTSQDQEENSTETSTTSQDQEENSTETSTTSQDQEENSTETSTTSQDQEEIDNQASENPDDSQIAPKQQEDISSNTENKTEEHSKVDSTTVITSSESTEVEKSSEDNTKSVEKTQPENADDAQKENSASEEEPETTDNNVDDFANYSKEDYLTLIKKLGEESDYRKFAPILREIKPLFDDLVNHEKKIAREAFIAEIGNDEGFDYKDDATTTEFYKIYNEIQKDRTAQIAKIEAEKEMNLQRKNEILEKIRKLTESEESQASIDELKKLQSEWKEIGQVPGQHNRSLWASYNALIDLFYDKRSIYFELKELDRKKNLATKLALCEKAEKLVEYESIKQAIKELNELHEEFKHIGPVPKEEQENLWQRFKTASDRVYDKKREFIKQREEEKVENYGKKLELCEKITPYAEFQSDKMTEWNAKTKEILQIQKEWEAIRFIPRDKIKELSKKFWTPFKAFFNNKNAFIKTLDEEREANLKLKEELCVEAENVVESDQDGRAIAEKLKELQRKWKEIGPVPSKFRQSIYERFKKTCDSFFEKRRERYANQEKEYEANLVKKEELCKTIEAHNPTEEEESKDVLNKYIDNWKAIGFVPKKDKRDIQKKFEEALYSYIEKLQLPLEAQEKLNLFIDVTLSKESPFANKKLKQKESAIRRKINKLENDIDVLRNNIGFLANSKKADKLKESLEVQIKDHASQLKVLKAQLKALKDI